MLVSKKSHGQGQTSCVIVGSLCIRSRDQLVGVDQAIRSRRSRNSGISISLRLLPLHSVILDFIINGPTPVQIGVMFATSLLVALIVFPIFILYSKRRGTIGCEPSNLLCNGHLSILTFHSTGRCGEGSEHARRTKNSPAYIRFGQGKRINVLFLFLFFSFVDYHQFLPLALSLRLQSKTNG